ncbi:hypothetical protein Dda_8395 [Drechslerella dactyloides]|uniref:HIG1 domain-containing protein n=1 Tax=Drechslerella dactyloides TaxID=74499 RepID=A0AAD6IQA7_DREDA|nr:hypothetical protein Dda_8395 [Drechslerella dactyloides]
MTSTSAVRWRAIVGYNIIRGIKVPYPDSHSLSATSTVRLTNRRTRKPEHLLGDPRKMASLCRRAVPAEPGSIKRAGFQKACYCIRTSGRTHSALLSHYAATIRGGIKGGVAGLGIGIASAFVLNRRSAFFRSLTLPLKTFFVTSSATFALIVAAENASHSYEVSRHADSSYNDENARLLAQSREYMSSKEKAMDWGREHRYQIVGASWAASMAGSLALVYRDKYLTKAQKLVQARVYAQGLTLLVLLASAAFEISDARSGRKRDVVMVPDPTDPTGKRMVERKIHHEQYKGQDLWMDMVRGEEERMKRRKEEEAAKAMQESK